ncbi:MAG: hypothetical protein ACI915_002249 [Gammaproteobacteria bacterium]|jgi:hypothetical protein
MGSSALASCFALTPPSMGSSALASCFALTPPSMGSSALASCFALTPPSMGSSALASCFALAFRPQLSSSSSFHGLVSPASSQSCEKAGFGHFRCPFSLSRIIIRPKSTLKLTRTGLCLVTNTHVRRAARSGDRLAVLSSRPRKSRFLHQFH